MPKNVRRFAWLWWISILIAACSILLSPFTDPALVKAGISQPSEVEFDFVVIAVMITLLVPFFWLAVSRQKNWARWVLFIFFVVTTIMNLFQNPTPHADNHILTAMEGATWLAEAVAFFFLFTGDARPWFNRKLPQLDADVFL